MYDNFCSLARRTTPLLEYIKNRKLEKQVGDALPGEYPVPAVSIHKIYYVFIWLYLQRIREEKREERRRRELEKKRLREEEKRKRREEERCKRKEADRQKRTEKEVKIKVILRKHSFPPECSSYSDCAM